MLCDVASIFVVRTLIVSQAYTMVLTLIDNTQIHIFMYSISRRHFTCPFTDLLYVNKRTANFMILIYTCNRGNLIVLCLAIEILSQGPSTKQRSYQAGSVLLGKPNAVGVKSMRSFVLF